MAKLFFGAVWSCKTMVPVNGVKFLKICRKSNNIFYGFRKFSSSDNEGKFDINGISINYIKVGNGPKPILCLPGAMGSIWSDFKPQIDKLDRNKFTVVVWDPPGYGKSRPPKRDFSSGFFDRDAEFAAELMRGLEFDRYSLLGWSDGGITALILASKYNTEVEKLVVWGANAYVTPDDVKIYQDIRDISKWSDSMRAPLIELYGEYYFRKTWETWVDSFVEILNKNGGDICRSALGDIKCPTLVIHGEKDAMVPKVHPEFLVKNIEGAQLLTFEKGKHNLHIRLADQFNEAVEKFIIT